MTDRLIKFTDDAFTAFWGFVWSVTAAWVLPDGWPWWGDLIAIGTCASVGGALMASGADWIGNVTRNWLSKSKTNQ